MLLLFETYPKQHDSFEGTPAASRRGKSTEIQNCAHTGYAGSAELNQLVITRRFERIDRFSAVI